jgi:hypothetical protein
MLKLIDINSISKCFKPDFSSNEERSYSSDDQKNKTI